MGEIDPGCIDGDKFTRLMLMPKGSCRKVNSSFWASGGMSPVWTRLNGTRSGQKKRLYLPSMGFARRLLGPSEPSILTRLTKNGSALKLKPSEVIGCVPRKSCQPGKRSAVGPSSSKVDNGESVKESVLAS